MTGSRTIQVTASAARNSCQASCRSGFERSRFAQSSWWPSEKFSGLHETDRQQPKFDLAWLIHVGPCPFEKLCPKGASSEGACIRASNHMRKCLQNPCHVYSKHTCVSRLGALPHISALLPDDAGRLIAYASHPWYTSLELLASAGKKWRSTCRARCAKRYQRKWDMPANGWTQSYKPA